MISVFITGVSRGLGRALMYEFVARNMTVYGTTRSVTDTEHLNSLLGSPHRIYTADSTDYGALEDIAHDIYAMSKVDIMIANAGIINIPAPAWMISDEEWNDVIGINIYGMINTMKAFVPRAIECNHGLFIGMSSGWGRSAASGLAPYCSSKFAVEGLMGSLDLDLKKEGTNVNCIALDPGGGINTDMLVACLPESHNEYDTADQWSGGAASFIINDLYATGKSGSFVIPTSS